MTESKPLADTAVDLSAIAPVNEAWEKACSYIGCKRNGKRIIGVDLKPPKHQEGIYFVLASPGSPIEYMASDV